MRKLLQLFQVSLLVLFAPSANAADLKLSSLFQDHMVLQRERPIKVWGWSDAGDKVTVSFAGLTKRATAGKDGKWMVTLAELKASSEGRVMTVASSASRQKVEIKDVLVGEVWVCSGQSNMMYTMSRFGNCAAEVPQMKYPLIRHLKVSIAQRATPQQDVFGAWAVCSPETAARFSATALYYAVELYKALGVPIGLINSSVGGTTVEQWSDLAALEANPDNEPVLQKRTAKVAAVEAAARANPELVAAYEKALRKYLSVVGVNPAAVNAEREQAFIRPDLSNALWTPTTLPRSIGNGVAWFARKVILPTEMIGKELTLNVGQVRRERTTYWNGIKLGTKSTHTIPASLTKGAKHLLSVRAAGIRGGGVSGEPSIIGSDGQTLSLTGDGWRLHVYASEPSLPKELSVRGVASGLYNGMIHPLIPYTIRGVIRYQGENNSGGYRYRKLFPDMIRGLAQELGARRFPVLFLSTRQLSPQAECGRGQSRLALDTRGPGHGDLAPQYRHGLPY